MLVLDAVCIKQQFLMFCKEELLLLFFLCKMILPSVTQPDLMLLYQDHHQYIIQITTNYFSNKKSYIVHVVTLTLFNMEA